MPSEHILLGVPLSLPPMIDDDHVARFYIDNIDMGMLKQRLVKTNGLTTAEADNAEHRYKNWLFLIRRQKDKGERMPPPPEIDVVWHCHILDSVAYYRDSNAIYGTYLHHSPYLGERGPADEAVLSALLQNTRRRWQEEYGEDLETVVYPAKLYSF